MLFAVAIAAVNSQFAVRSYAGLFKMDFGTLQNDAEGVVLTDWDTFATWTFADFPDGVATWKLTDFSNQNDNDVTLTIRDNVALSEQLGLAPPNGMTANNPTHEALDVVYDGINVPFVVKDDYLYRSPDTAGTEVLMRFANLNPGTYNVTVFEGRTTDANGRYGKVWVDDINGKKEPAAQNTGNYSGVDLDVGGVPTPVGQPRTVTVDIKAGEYLWFAEMEDNSGGISGMIIRGITSSSSVPLITVARTADGVALTYTGTLQAGNAVNGTYSDVTGATSPYSEKTTNAAKFFRARQ